MEVNVKYNLNIEIQNGKIPNKEYKNKNKEKLMGHMCLPLICSFHSRIMVILLWRDLMWGMREKGKGRVILRCVLENRRAVCTSVGTKGEVGNELNF